MKWERNNRIAITRVSDPSLFVSVNSKLREDDQNYYGNCSKIIECKKILR